MSTMTRDRIASAIDALAYYTDCQIATYATICDRKATSQADKRRHRDLCEGMLKACKRFGVEADGLRWLYDRFNRVEQDS